MLSTIGVAAGVVGLTLVQPLATTAAPVVMAALIIEGSSTNPSGAGIEDFYQGKFDAPSPIRINFLTGPSGIFTALTRPDNVDGPNIVMSSGWGAANASLLISYLASTDSDNPALTNTTWVLDNNVAAPNGGFGTRYPVFALIGVNPIPTPSEANGAVVISTTHEYDLNGNAPRYVGNGFSALNSLMAYFDRRLNQAELPMPVDADGTVRDPASGDPVTCQTTCTFSYPDEAGGTMIVRVTQVGDVTYVGYEAPGLPLTGPLRRDGGDLGNEIADVVEPALAALVRYGYPNSDPLADPGTTVRAGLIPTPAETRLFLSDFATGVQQGLASIGVPHDATAQPTGPDTAAALRAESESTESESDVAGNEVVDAVDDTVAEDPAAVNTAAEDPAAEDTAAAGSNDDDRAAGPADADPENDTGDTWADSSGEPDTTGPEDDTGSGSRSRFAQHQQQRAGIGEDGPTSRAWNALKRLSTAFRDRDSDKRSGVSAGTAGTDPA